MLRREEITKSPCESGEKYGLPGSIALRSRSMDLGESLSSGAGVQSEMEGAGAISRWGVTRLPALPRQVQLNKHCRVGELVTHIMALH